MTQEEIYILIGRIERLMSYLRPFERHNLTPQPNPFDEALDCGNYAEQVCAYVRATNDKQVMVDCCKINRQFCYRYGNNNDDFRRSIRKTGYFLFQIHNIALERIWGVSREDIEKCTYYVNSYEGVCRDSKTGDLLPLPEATDTGKQAEPQKQGLPRELDITEAYSYFARAVKLGLMSNDFKWGKGLQLLTCFAREMSLKLNLGKGTNADGTPRISWKPFEQLFGIETGKLRANYNDIQKTGQQPIESNLIDEVFS